MVRRKEEGNLHRTDSFICVLSLMDAFVHISRVVLAGFFLLLHFTHLYLITYVTSR